jgi:hypothetical protein
MVVRVHLRPDAGQLGLGARSADTVAGCWSGRLPDVTVADPYRRAASRLEDRVKAHALIGMSACYLTWHLREGWAPLTYTDEHPHARANPVTPACRSAAAATKTGPGKQPIRVGGQLAIPTTTQRSAFDRIGAPIPSTLT